MTLEFPACASLGGAYMAPVDEIAPLGWNDIPGIILSLYILIPLMCTPYITSIPCQDGDCGASYCICNLA